MSTEPLNDEPSMDCSLWDKLGWNTGHHLSAMEHHYRLYANKGRLEDGYKGFAWLAPYAGQGFAFTNDVFEQRIQMAMLNFKGTLVNGILRPQNFSHTWNRPYLPREERRKIWWAKAPDRLRKQHQSIGKKFGNNFRGSRQVVGNPADGSTGHQQ